jgi:TM2 domain-containing membrane protein YozV
MTEDQPEHGTEVKLPRFADAVDPLTLIAADPSKQARWDRLHKSKAKAYLLWAFLGVLGGHRFYLGYYPSGIFQALMCVLGAILAFATPIGVFVLVAPALWLLVDAAIVPAIVRHQNADLIEQILR